MSNAEYSPYPALHEQLLLSLQQRCSGMFLVATDANTSCRFAIANGQLTHCTLSRLHGEEALIAFTRVKAGRYSFNNLLQPFRPAAAVTHERAMAILGMPQAISPSNHDPAKPKLVSGSLFTQEEIEQLWLFGISRGHAQDVVFSIGRNPVRSCKSI